MQTLSVNASNDIYLTPQGNIAIAYDLTAVLQNCEQAVKTLLGEMVLNTDQGVPYFQNVFTGTPNLQQFTAALRVAILSVPNVLEVVTLTAEFSSDILSYAATIRTSFGTGVI